MPRIGFLASMAVVAVILAAPSPAIAQQTPEEHAHQWTEARRGDRDWMQRATEQLTMGPLDRMMGPSADEAMKQILNNVIDHIDAMYNRRMDPCLAAAVNQAHNQSLTIGRQEIMRGAAEMLFDAGGGAGHVTLAELATLRSDCEFAFAGDHVVELGLAGVGVDLLLLAAFETVQVACDLRRNEEIDLGHPLR